jgi:hypothetical protein
LLCGLECTLVPLRSNVQLAAIADTNVKKLHKQIMPKTKVAKTLYPDAHNPPQIAQRTLAKKNPKTNAKIPEDCEGVRKW